MSILLPVHCRKGKNSEVLGQTKQALLLRMEEAESPFLEQTALWLTETTQMADRAFSLAEAEQFVEALPLVAAVGVVFAAGIVFWLLACIAWLFFEKHKGLIWICFGLMGVSLMILAILCSVIELPASMMPPDNIFQWQHYCEEMTLITDALKEMNDVVDRNVGLNIDLNIN